MERQQQVGGPTSSTEDYEQIADKYESSYQVMPYRIHVEEYSVRQFVGNVQGLQVLDVASGTGHYSRLMRSLGAESVVGVDISPDMVHMARQTEAEEPMGNIEYHVQDAAALETLGQFDLAVAIYLFHYATSLEHLQSICHGVARNLRPGARFLTYAISPDFSLEKEYYRPYLMDMFPTPNMRDGDAYSFIMVVEGGWTPPLTVHYWTWETMEGALRQAGFETVRRLNPILSPAGLEQFEPGFWQNYLDCPNCIFLEATKAL